MKRKITKERCVIKQTLQGNKKKAKTKQKVKQKSKNQ